ncbi:MAG: YdiU family protein [Acidobacteriota bacterium]
MTDPIQPLEGLVTFDNTYARLPDGFFVPWRAEPASRPQLLKLNESLAAELGFDPDVLAAAAAEVFSGNIVPRGAEPIAQAYAGHQFGGFSPQLGDGRALLLGEVKDQQGRRLDVQLKGSGRTPFSRGGDGKAAIGPVLREYLVAEAMHALGVPTTRALAAVATGDPVYRETALPGAVLTRVASSHLRVGTFQFFAARDQRDHVEQLMHYAIDRHDPQAADSENPALALLAGVVERQALLVSRWMLLGFVHGVMNTDNSTISGETIDYGPCAFMESYDPASVYSSIDHGGRYAFGNQPKIALWNLARLAETLIPLIDSDEERAVARAKETLDGFPEAYVREQLRGSRAKLGLRTETEGDAELFQGLLELLEAAGADYTNSMRALARAAEGDTAALRSRVETNERAESLASDWITAWQARLSKEPEATSAGDRIRSVNPLYVPRNEKVEDALRAAEEGDLTPFDRLLERTTAPFERVEGFDDLTEPASPESPPYRTFCGT